jgi:hypothetical protein
MIINIVIVQKEQKIILLSWKGNDRIRLNTIQLVLQLVYRIQYKLFLAIGEKILPDSS